jgi:hypothetical protein
MIEKGLCELVDSVNDILDEAEGKRKPRHDMMDEMTYRNRQCGCYDAGKDPDYRY